MASFQVVVISITVIWRRGTHHVIRLSLPTLRINVRSLSLVFSQLATGCLYSTYEISSSSRSHHTSGLEDRRTVVLFLAFVQIFIFSKAPNQP